LLAGARYAIETFAFTTEQLRAEFFLEQLEQLADPPVAMYTADRQPR